MKEKNIQLIEIVLIFFLLLGIGFLAGRIQQINKENKIVRVENVSANEYDQLFLYSILDILEELSCK